MGMKVFRIVKLIVLCLIATFLISGCYILSGVQSHEIGLLMDNGVKVNNVVGPGRYTHLGFFAAKFNMDCSAKTLTWEDPDLWTKDKQPVRFRITVTYARKRDAQSAKQMWENYNLEAKNDQALSQLVSTRIPRVAKQVTTMFTLDEMLGIAEGLGGREVLQERMMNLLAKELNEFSVQLLDVGVNDIGADENYVAQLKEKAVSKVAVEVAAQKTKQLEEQVKQEKAQTQVSLEIAKRKNLVAAEENRIYTLNPQAYQLERLRLMKDMISDKDKIFFVPQGCDITFFLDSEGKVVPVKK